MKASHIIVLQAISSALTKSDLSTLSGELQKELGDAIIQLENLVTKNDPLNKLYEAERIAIKENYQVQERNKGYRVANDNPNDSDPGNVSPPSPQSESAEQSASETAHSSANFGSNSG